MCVLLCTVNNGRQNFRVTSLLVVLWLKYPPSPRAAKYRTFDTGMCLTVGSSTCLLSYLLLLPIGWKSSEEGDVSLPCVPIAVAGPQ